MDLPWKQDIEAECHRSLTLPFAAAGRGEGLWWGNSVTYPSSAGLTEMLQTPGLWLLAICWHFDLFPHHPSQPRLSNFCFFTSWSVSRVQIPSSLASPQLWEWSIKQTLNAWVKQTLQQTGTWCWQHFLQKLEYLGWDLTKQLPGCPGRQPVIQRSERCAWCHILSNTAPNRGVRCPFLSGRKFLVCQKNKTERASSTSWANSAFRGFAKKTRRDTSTHRSALLLSELFAGTFAAHQPGCWTLCKTAPLICQTLTASKKQRIQCLLHSSDRFMPHGYWNHMSGELCFPLEALCWKSQCCAGSFPSPWFNWSHWVTITQFCMSSAYLSLSNFSV